MISVCTSSATAPNGAERRIPAKALRKTAAALCAALAFNALSFDGSLSPQAQGVLAALIFMTIIWVTEAVPFATSALFLIVSMTLFTAFTPTADGTLLGTKKALSTAVNGFRSGSWFLVVAALFLAAAIENIGLGKRLALTVLARAGSKPRRMRAAILLLCFLLTLFIPAQAANAALMTAVCLGILQALSINRKSNLAKGLMLAIGFGCPLAGLGVLTSGAPPIQTADLIYQATGYQITWLAWLVYNMPFALLLGFVLFWLIEWQFPVQAEAFPNHDDTVRQELAALGPLRGKEKKLLIILCCTILLWSTGTIVHPVDNTTVALIAVVAMLMPGINVASWDELKNTVSWGTLLLFGGAISLGQALLATGAAAWVVDSTIVRLGVVSWPPTGIIAAGGLFFVLFSLAFSSRAAATAALMPTAIEFTQAIPGNSGTAVWGLSLLLYYPIQFAVILPVNSPMSMVAYATGTFSTAEMVKISVPLCLCALAGMVLVSHTYWRWIGIF